MSIWRRLLFYLCVLCALCGSTWPALAQEELRLSVRRNMGFSSGSQIQGSFRMEASGPTDLNSVTFKVDETVVGTVTTPPFTINFSTDDYPVGWHALTAVGRTADGRTLVSAPRRFEFVSPAQEWAAVRDILIPLFGGLGLVLLIVLAIPLVQTFAGKRAELPLGAPRKYGAWGGTICPKCSRPFSIHWWSLHWGLWKFDRCDHCGRWSLTRPVRREKLTEAEAAELKMAGPQTPLSEMSAEEKLRQQLEASRFLDER